MKRLLILFFFLVLIFMAFYFGVLHVTQAGGAVASVRGWLPARPVRTPAHMPSLGASQIVTIFVAVLILWSVFHQGPNGRFRN